MRHLHNPVPDSGPYGFCQTKAWRNIRGCLFFARGFLILDRIDEGGFVTPAKGLEAGRITELLAGLNEQLLFYGVAHQFRDTFKTKFAVYVAFVRTGHFVADKKLLGNLADTFPLHNQAKYL